MTTAHQFERHFNHAESQAEENRVIDQARADASLIVGQFSNEVRFSFPDYSVLTIYRAQAPYAVATKETQ